MSQPEKTLPESEVHALLRRAFAMRAAAYAHTYDVLREELGEERARVLSKRATRRMGEAMGRAFQDYAPNDLTGLTHAFLEAIIEGEALFKPEVVQADSEAMRVLFHRCPLKEAWHAQGRSDADIAALCEIAGAIDIGLFEGAGFTFAGETWRVGDEGCCRLCVLPGKADAEEKS
ncbi:MAG: L-2-amino-thiazoline-4-carboxylic acid hydrolase [Hyphomicrobiaceae bacterium]